MIPEYLFTDWFWAEFFGYSLGDKIQSILLNPELFVIFAVPTGALVYALFKLIKLVFRKKRRITHGSAEWGTLQDAEKAELVIGYIDPAKKKELVKKKEPIFVETIENTEKTLVGRVGGKIIGVMYHLIVIAKTRAGKGVAYVITNLLKYRGSIICNDIKGENYAKTARQRRKFGNVYRFDPFECFEDEESHCFNPLDYIQDGDKMGNLLATELAFIIAPAGKDGTEDFFTKYARKIIYLFILYVCVIFDDDREKRTLSSVREIITMPQEVIRALLVQMSEMTEFRGNIRKNATSMLSVMGNGGEESATYMSVAATADTLTAFLDEPGIQTALSKTDFRLEMFKYEPSTLYVVVESNYLEVSQMLLKIIYTYAIRLNMLRKTPFLAKEAGLKKMKYPIKFFMDEFAQLEYFKIVKKYMPLCAGIGVWFCIIIQSVEQLREHYGKGAADFLNNATRIFMGAEDIETAKVISDFCNKTTVEQESSTLRPADLVGNVKQSENIGSTARDLLTVGEALQLSVETPILTAGGVKPLKLKRLVYYKDPEFEGLADKFDSH